MKREDIQRQIDCYTAKIDAYSGLLRKADREENEDGCHKYNSLVWYYHGCQDQLVGIRDSLFPDMAYKRTIPFSLEYYKEVVTDVVREEVGNCPELVDDIMAVEFC